MIDIEGCTKKFKEYVDNYDMNHDKINLKYYHTLRVMEICGKIAESLNLNEDDKKLSMLIGLLHDIGRFEQAKIYNTFSDKDSIDHADYGVEILTKENFIDEFLTDKNLQRIVLIALKNHNKLMIEEGLDDRTLMFCKLIRDADKLDIFNLFLQQEARIKKTDSLISDKIYNQLMSRELISNLDIVTDMDNNLRHIGMLFDLNYEYSFNCVKKNRLIDKLVNQIIEKNTHEIKKLLNIKNKLDEFFDSK